MVCVGVIVQLSNEQREVLNYMLGGSRSVFLTGNAGTGKSTIIREYRRLTENDSGIVYLAPTGIAALNIQGGTIHSFFRVPVGILGLDGLDMSSKFKSLAKSVHTLVVDEISMVRADLLDAMDQLLRQVGGKKSRGLPFGGKRLIMIGDLCQLPPVVTRNETSYFQMRFGAASGWVFLAPSFEALDPKVFHLQESFRQRDQTFVDLLNRIRDGDATAVHVLNEHAKYGPASDHVVVLTATNKQAVQYNEVRLQQIDSKPKTYTGQAWGKFFPHMFPVPEDLVLKVGARVILTRNSEEYLNGSVGTVQAMGSEDVTVRLDETGKNVLVNKVKWDNYEYEFDGDKVESKSKGTYEQFPIKHAWGMTIHKSQGQGFQEAFIHLGKGAFAHGQLYVALSRITSLEGLHLHSKLKPSDVIIDPEVVRFQTRPKADFCLR